MNIEINTALITGIIGLLATILSAGISSMLTTYYHKYKLRIEQKVQYEGLIGEKIAIAMNDILTTQLKTDVIENYSLVLSGAEYESAVYIEDISVYHSILSDRESLFSFYQEVNNARVEYDRYLDRKTSAYLQYMERYLMDLCNFMDNIDDINFPTFSGIIFDDIYKWNKNLNVWLIKQINRRKVKMYSKVGIRWELQKKIVYLKLERNSIFYKLIEKKTNKLPIETQNRLLLILNQGENKNE